MDNKDAHRIAKKRIEYLLALAESEALRDNFLRGKRYVELARRIGLRTNTSMPKGFMYCRKCLNPLIPGKNCHVRLRSNRVVIHCHNCGNIKRIPYLKEKRKAKKCQGFQEPS
ncbi:MAG: ribonuclease P protein component 4 [Methanomassiliicoccales archaeon]|nr:ribonuclease P protein component 4 [Methanomassiliicoccales archaeon]